MGLVVGHVVGGVDNNCRAGGLAFKVADGAVGVLDCPAGDVVRRLLNSVVMARTPLLSPTRFGPCCGAATSWQPTQLLAFTERGR